MPAAKFQPAEAAAETLTDEPDAPLAPSAGGAAAGSPPVPSPPSAADSPVQEWVYRARVKRFSLLLGATDPNWQERENALRAMSLALEEAIEKVQDVWEASEAEVRELRREVARLRQAALAVPQS
jgi:hypothetical protein